LFGIGLFLRQMDVSFEIAGQGGKLFFRSNLLFGAFALAQNALRSFLIAPEIGIGDAGFEGFQAFAVCFGVKDNSGRA
jgi:hypothetical protein